MSKSPLRIALTVGEPAGIGPDIVIQLAEQDLDCQISVLVDPCLLDQRAQQLGSSLRCINSAQQKQKFGRLTIMQGHTLAVPVQTGELNQANSVYVFESIKAAAQLCLSKEVDAMVTAPVHKGVINDAGLVFSGHTELIAEVCHDAKPVMMLANEKMRVALVTTHLPLSEVAAAITPASVSEVIRIVSQDLRTKFGLASPRIVVCGLNPHAGEGGHLGREELDIIIPSLSKLSAEGIETIGPVPADTAFTPPMLKQADIVIAMYHDQGLPVIKAQGFGEIVNITLGLPIIRTSVDHGTALDLAGTGKASEQSLLAAIEQAKVMCRVRDGA